MAVGKARSIRAQDEIWAAAQAEADRNGQSLNSWVVETLRRRLDMPDQLTRPEHQYQNPSDLVVAEVPAGTKPAEPRVSNKPWSDPDSDPVGDIRRTAEAMERQAAEPRPPCVHPKPARVKHSWGTICGECGERVR